MRKGSARTRRTSVAIAVAQATIEALEGRRLLAAGDLDTTFSNDGRVEVSLPVSSTHYPDLLADTAILANGDIFSVGPVSVSGSGPDLGTMQLTESGILDTSYDGDGIKVIPDDLFTEVGGVVGDGTMLRISGRRESGAMGGEQMALVSVAGDGSAYNIELSGAIGSTPQGDVVLIPETADVDYHIATTGFRSAGSAGDNSEIVVSVFDDNGDHLENYFGGFEEDPDLGHQGKDVVALPDVEDRGGDLIIAAIKDKQWGDDVGQIQLFLFDHTNLTDPISTIGSPLDGEYVEFGPDRKNDVAIELTPDGTQIVVGAYDYEATSAPYTFARFNLDDYTWEQFNSSGTVQFGGTSQSGHRQLDVAVQDDEKIVFAHSANTGMSDATFTIHRLNRDGTLDTRWGGTGVV